jgi:galactonate dehydratase
MDRRATESEYIRAALSGAPALEAAVSNAMLDLVSRAENVPIYRYLGGPVRFKARLLGHLEGATAAESAPSLERAKRQGIQAFTTAAPTRDAMIPLRVYVDRVRQKYADMQRLAGAPAECVLDGAGAMAPADAASVAVVLSNLIPSGSTSQRS